MVRHREHDHRRVELPENVTYNPAVALILGAWRPAGNLGIIYPTEATKERSCLNSPPASPGLVLYLVSDVYKFLRIHEAKTSRPDKPGVLCHEGVDMTDGTRSNYVLHRTESGGFVMGGTGEVGIRLPFPTTTSKL